MEKNQYKELITKLREIMKANEDDSISDQEQGLPQPSIAREKTGDKVIQLTKKFDNIITNNDFLNILNTRTSKRKYTEASLTLDELAFLLWATQGVKQIAGRERKATFRTVPSAGARHPFETYLFVNRVEGLGKGLYHYLALEHKLEFLGSIDNQAAQVTEAFCGQIFYGNAPVAFVWTVIPYRSEWRYTINAQKYALVDAGHVCQNLYLASESIGCGACGIGAYEQSLADGLLGLDSKPSDAEENEFVVYAASVGKIDKKEA
ncbi:MAG: SagB/ThcOx family dehydrogenase [Anaerocolumna sp.]